MPRFIFPSVVSALVVVCLVGVLAGSNGPGATSAPQNAHTSNTAPAVPATQSAGAAAKDESAAEAASVPQITLGPGDLINVAVFGVPELTQDVRVSSTGDVYLPLVGHVQVAGLTPDETQSVVEKRLRDGGFLNNPHVAVSIKEYINASATVMGEVAHPGTYPVIGSRRLLDIIAAAGGFTDKAGTLVTITHRDRPEEPVNVHVSRDPAEAARTNVEVTPGDTVMVSKAGVVYVVGEVGRPCGLIMDNNEQMSALQAIAMAGGLTSFAKTEQSKILRKTNTGRTEIPLPLKQILANKSTDVQLKADDILFVPSSSGKKATARGLATILQTASMLAVYHP